MFLINRNAEIFACILSFRKSRQKPNVENTSKSVSSPDVSVCQKTTNRRNQGAVHHEKDDPSHDPLRTSLVLVSLVAKSARARLGTRQLPHMFYPPIWGKMAAF